MALINYRNWLSDTNRQNINSFDYTYLFLFHWVEKWSHCGRALDHLESFGTKIMTNGPIVCQLWEWGSREASIDIKIN